MTEIEELKDKLTEHEKRIRFLEETIQTLADINKSSLAGEFIEKRKQTLAMSKMINSVSSGTLIDENGQAKEIENLSESKRELDEKISQVIADEGNWQDEALAKCFTYTENDLGELIIWRYNGSGNIRKLVIPKTICGKTVSHIYDSAFANMNMDEVLIPDSVSTIGANAFKNCMSLTQVKLPDSVTDIGDSTFKNCVNLNNVRLSAQLTYIWKEAFKNCKNLKHINLPDSLRWIDRWCFAGTALEEITIPLNVSRLNNPFSDCKNLSKVVFNKSPDRIRRCFFDCENINEIVLSELVAKVSTDGLHCTAFSFSTKPSKKVSIIFKGPETELEGNPEDLENCVIYCLPGSVVEKNARDMGLTVKPLAEFNG